MDLAELRPVVSKGARAMLNAGFPDVEASERERWVKLVKQLGIQPE